MGEGRLGRRRNGGRRRAGREGCSGGAEAARGLPRKRVRGEAGGLTRPRGCGLGSALLVRPQPRGGRPGLPETLPPAGAASAGPAPAPPPGSGRDWAGPVLETAGPPQGTAGGC